jgi:hypothetical protein
MANATAAIQMNGIGQDGRRFHVPVAAATTIYEGTMVAQLATGFLVPATTAGAGPIIGKATHTIVNGGAAGDKRCLIETDRIYAMTNGTSGDAFSEATQLGAPVYALDDNSVADNDSNGTRQPCGTFYGMEPDGKVRVFISPGESDATPRIQTGRGTFAAGVLAVTAGITVTATSRVFASRVTEAGTDGDEIRVPDADRTVGGPGTGALTFRAFSAGAAATSDTSTFDWMIVG